MILTAIENPKISAFGSHAFHRLVLLAAAGTALAAHVCVAQNVLLRGLVRDQSGRPLPFSTITIDGNRTSTTANAEGAFVASLRESGPHRVLVRHVGYAPLDTTIDVKDSSANPAIVRLSHAAVSLETVVTTQARASCRSPGRPDATDSVLAVAFNQLEINAVQYRAVTERNPIALYFDRTVDDSGERHGVTHELHDTIVVRLNGRFDLYSPGHILERDSTLPSRPIGVRVPSLALFADSAFVAEHCFWFAGYTRENDETRIQISFAIADSVRLPDFNGSIFLSTKDFVIRRSALRLSRWSIFLPTVDSAIIVTDFDEPEESIVVPSEIRNTAYLRVSTRGSGPTTRLEIQRRFGVTAEVAPNSIAVVDTASTGQSSRSAATASSTSQPHAIAGAAVGFAGRTLRVVAAAADGPVRGADVTLSHPALGALIVATTDSSGEALLQLDTLVGAYIIRVRKVGFNASTTIRQLSDRTQDTLPVTLIRAPHITDTVHVVAAALRSKNYVLMADELSTASGRDIVDAFGALAKMRPNMLGDAARACPKVKNVWINGHRVWWDDASHGGRSRSRTNPLQRIDMGASHPPTLEDVLGTIRVEDISEVRYSNCWDSVSPELGMQDALFFILKSGFAWDWKNGSHAVTP